VILRSHQAGETTSTAAYSPCEGYRYSLTRVWDPAAPRLLIVMLNPSTADETRNDPTVARCEARARAMGQGAFRVVNLFAYRATDPRRLRGVADAVGPLNDQCLTDSVDWADAVLCAWGNHGALFQRAVTVSALLRAGGKPMFHLGTTGAGHPRHPLYVRSDQPLTAWPSDLRPPSG
jgi:hypothetical protein